VVLHDMFLLQTWGTDVCVDVPYHDPTINGLSNLVEAEVPALPSSGSRSASYQKAKPLQTACFSSAALVT
jgi:hypothetical protein